jgi:hypothetical protein
MDIRSYGIELRINLGQSQKLFFCFVRHDRGPNSYVHWSVNEKSDDRSKMYEDHEKDGG